MVQMEKELRHDEPNGLYSLQECLMFSRNVDTGRCFQSSRVAVSQKSRQLSPRPPPLSRAFHRYPNTTSRNTIKAVLMMGAFELNMHYRCQRNFETFPIRSYYHKPSLSVQSNRQPLLAKMPSIRNILIPFSCDYYKETFSNICKYCQRWHGRTT